MRQLAYALLLTSAGCSLIYNPSNLPAAPSDGNDNVDMEIDARPIIDANASMPTITSVTPAQLFEGTGTSNGRKAVVVVTGDNFVNGAKILIARQGETTPITGVTVDDTKIDVSEDHKMVAAPVVIAVDTNFATSDTPIPLDVIVEQPDGSGGTASASATAMLELVGLDELTDSDLPLAPGVHTFSEATLTNDLILTTGNAPLQIRVMGGITFTGTADVSATGQTGGPGATGGGTGGGAVAGNTAGGPGGAPGGGVTGGGGGGYGGNGGGGANGGVAHGDPEITVLGNPNLGSGGAGGNGNAVTVTTGGAGGGGGGTIELTANGTISLATVTSDGADGTLKNAAQSGGGGSGGLILVRGAAVTVSGGLSVAGGISESGGAVGSSAGSNGSVGRIRIDSAAATIPVTSPAAYRGPMLAASTPLIVREKRPTLTFLGQPQRMASYQISNFDGSSVRNVVVQSLGNGSNAAQLAGDSELFEGLNTICLYVDKADLQQAEQRPEARNCIQIVRLFMNE